MNAVSPITTSSELDHEIMRRLEAASPQLGRRGFLSLTGMAGAGSDPGQPSSAWRRNSARPCAIW